MITKLKNLFFGIWLAVGLSMIALSGCQSLGLAPAKTFDSQLAYAYGTHTAVLNATASAVSAKTLSRDQGQKILSLSDQAKTLLDTARAAETAGDSAGATKNLTLALSVLSSLQTYLNKGATP